ncbi:MAG: nuclear transport factor 2 family protein [Bryobacteraceae bacterium]
MHKSRNELITAAYSAFNRRDIDAVLALMTPDVDWPNGMEGGRVIGHDQVRAYWTRQWSIVNPHVEPVDIEQDQSGTVLVRVHQVVRDLSDNVLLDRFVNHVYSFESDLINRMEIREESKTAESTTPDKDRSKDPSNEQQRRK